MTLLRTKPACPVCGRALELKMMDFFEHDCLAALADRVLALEGDNRKLRYIAGNAMRLTLLLARFLDYRIDKIEDPLEGLVKNAKANLDASIRRLPE